MQFIGSTGKVLKTGLILWQTNSNAIILDNSVPADCLEKVVNLKTGQILFGKVDARARETCCRPSDDNTRSRFKISRCSI